MYNFIASIYLQTAKGWTSFSLILLLTENIVTRFHLNDHFWSSEQCVHKSWLMHQKHALVWNTDTYIHLWIVCGCFLTTRAIQMCQDQKARKGWCKVCQVSIFFFFGENYTFWASSSVLHSEPSHRLSIFSQNIPVENFCFLVSLPSYIGEYLPFSNYHN